MSDDTGGMRKAMKRGSRLAVRFQAVVLSVRSWAHGELAEDWIERRIPDDMGATRENGEDKDGMREDRRGLSAAENRRDASSALVESHSNRDG